MIVLKEFYAQPQKSVTLPEAPQTFWNKAADERSSRIPPGNDGGTADLHLLLPVCLGERLLT